MNHFDKYIEECEKEEQFLTVQEIEKRVLAFTNDSFISVNQIGTSEKGRKVYCLKFGAGEKSIFILANTRGSVPSGSSVIFSIIDLFKKNVSFFESFNGTFYLFPCIDPDSAVLNEEWFKGELSLKKYVMNYYSGKELSNKKIVEDYFHTNEPDILIELHMQSFDTSEEIKRNLKKRAKEILKDELEEELFREKAAKEEIKEEIIQKKDENFYSLLAKKENKKCVCETLSVSLFRIDTFHPSKDTSFSIKEASKETLENDLFLFHAFQKIKLFLNKKSPFYGLFDLSKEDISYKEREYEEIQEETRDKKQEISSYEYYVKHLLNNALLLGEFLRAINTTISSKSDIKELEDETRKRLQETIERIDKNVTYTRSSMDESISAQLQSIFEILKNENEMQNNSNKELNENNNFTSAQENKVNDFGEDKKEDIHVEERRERLRTLLRPKKKKNTELSEKEESSDTETKRSPLRLR